jgi:glycosyltransferase involved in cell wall biosynthesis
MKILWFSPVEYRSDNTSGSWVVSLANKISDVEGIELNIAFDSGTKNVTELKSGKITCWHIPSNYFSKAQRLMSNLFNRDIDPKIIEYYIEVVRKVNPEIIQIFGTESNHAGIIFNCKAPVIIHIQCIYTIYHHKYFSGISENDLKKYSTIKRRLSKNSYIDNYKRKKIVVERELGFYKECKHFMGRTDWDRRCSKVLSPSSKYYHCDEAIRDEFFKYIWKKRFDGKTINLISVIGGALYKGFETIVETIEILEKSNLYINWKVIGINEDSEIVHICKKKYGRNSFEKIKFLGRINSADIIIKEMLNSDIFVHSSHIENSPNSVCEALLLGMPVIATHTGGTSSLLKDSESGILIQDGDPRSLAGAII